MRTRLAAGVLVVASGLVACTGAQLRGAGQMMHRQQCDRLPDIQERARCLERLGPAGDARGAVADGTARAAAGPSDRPGRRPRAAG